MYIEENTRTQRESELWRLFHRGRITSSLFGEVLHANSPKSLIQRILNGSDLNRYETLPKQVQWGASHETDALADYIVLQSAVTPRSVTLSGLTLLPSYSFLAVSEDDELLINLRQDQEFFKLSVRPYAVNGQLVNTMEIFQIVELSHREFCLEMSDQGPRLRRDHKYYAQVQGEMALMSCSWCDFVVWTAANRSNRFIERIYSKMSG